MQDLFRAGYTQPTQASLKYANHPITRLVLAEVRAQLEARQGNAEAARSLRVFLARHDQGSGTVRVEDFKAGWSLSGIRLSPSQLHSIKGAYGCPGGIRYLDLLEALDALGHQQGLSIIMTHRMGSVTARHLGFTQGNPVMKGYLHHASRAQSSRGGAGALLGLSTMQSPNSLMRTSNIKPVVQPPTDTARGTYNCTVVTNAIVTQRHKSMAATTLRSVMEKISTAARTSPDLTDTLVGLDTGSTGCVTLDSFLTACARAGLTLRPDELDTMRTSGLLRRPYDAAPELIDYGLLELPTGA